MTLAVTGDAGKTERQRTQDLKKTLHVKIVSTLMQNLTLAVTEDVGKTLVPQPRA